MATETVTLFDVAQTFRDLVCQGLVCPTCEKVHILYSKHERWKAYRADALRVAEYITLGCRGRPSLRDEHVDRLMYAVEQLILTDKGPVEHLEFCWCILYYLAGNAWLG